MPIEKDQAEVGGDIPAGLSPFKRFMPQRPKPKPFLRSAKLIIVLTPLAFMWGVGARMVIEVFNFGWNFIPW